MALRGTAAPRTPEIEVEGWGVEVNLDYRVSPCTDTEVPVTIAGSGNPAAGPGSTVEIHIHCLPFILSILCQ